MMSLTLEQKIQMINQKLIQIANEHYGKQYVQNIPRASKELKKLRGLSYKLRYDMDKLLEIERKNEIQYFNTIEPYEIVPYKPSWN